MSARRMRWTQRRTQEGAVVKSSTAGNDVRSSRERGTIECA